METDKVLSSLSYFSILFAAFIFPLVLYFVTDSKEVKYHAKKAFISHLIPVVFGIIIFLLFVSEIMINETGYPFLSIISFVVFGIVSVVVLVWNIIKGIQVLQS